MTTLLLSHPVFLDHDTGYGHPERPDRMRAIDKVLQHEMFAALQRRSAPLREDAEAAILRAHPIEHLALLKASRPRGGGDPTHVDGDTVMSQGTWEAALRAVGATLEAVDEVMTAGNGIANAFCQVRPPGHHAESRRAMGFCFFNNAAIGAYHARAVHGATRVAVIDWDVHHGNGTQEIFWSDKDMFYGSTHQMPLYPGTGALAETGVGNIFNAPLRAGDGAESFRAAFESRILGPLRHFGPDLVIVSAGFDAHADDPLGGLALHEADFLWATRELTELAARQCGGRIVSVLEGGYDLRALARSVGVHVRALMDAGT